MTMSAGILQRFPARNALDRSLRLRDASEVAFDRDHELDRWDDAAIASLAVGQADVSAAGRRDRNDVCDKVCGQANEIFDTQSTVHKAPLSAIDRSLFGLSYNRQVVHSYRSTQ